MEDLKKIQDLASAQSLKPVVIGGYAVRAYTRTRIRYTKDIDLALPRREESTKLRGILARLGYSITEKPYGLSGYRKVRGVAIVVNTIIDDVWAEEKEIKSFYPVGISIKANVSSIEDLLILKSRVWRERDIIDLCLLLLESFNSINVERLKQRLRSKDFYQGFQNSLKRLLNLIGKKKFHLVWEDFMGRKIEKGEEEELWKKLNELNKLVKSICND